MMRYLFVTGFDDGRGIRNLNIELNPQGGSDANHALRVYPIDPEGSVEHFSDGVMLDIVFGMEPLTNAPYRIAGANSPCNGGCADEVVGVGSGFSRYHCLGFIGDSCCRDTNNNNRYHCGQEPEDSSIPLDSSVSSVSFLIFHFLLSFSFVFLPGFYLILFYQVYVIHIVYHYFLQLLHPVNKCETGGTFVDEYVY